MTRLPAEVLDNIVDLAIALRIAKMKVITQVCFRWKLRYQPKLFKSVKLDPFSNNIFDLDHPDYKHLIPYIQELCVVDRSDSSTLDNYNRDLTAPFADFLLHAQHVTSLLLYDSRIQWDHVSHNTVKAFSTVFLRKSFRSLEVFVESPVPSSMLLHGMSVASDLTVHCIGPIIAPLRSVDLASYQCSLTRLLLFGDTSIEEVTKFCFQHQDLANTLLRHVDELVMDYTYPSAWLGTSWIPYPKVFLTFLAPQLKVVDLRVRSWSKASSLQISATNKHALVGLPSRFSVSAAQGLKSLQHLIIYFDSLPLVPLTGKIDTMKSAARYMQSVLSTLTHPSSVKSISLRINDRTGLNSDVDAYKDSFHQLFTTVHRQVCCSDQWPCLTSIRILINVNDTSLTGTFSEDKQMKYNPMDLKIFGHLHVNAWAVTTCSTA